MPLARTVFEPDDLIEFSDDEYESLLRQGLIYDGEAVVTPPAFFPEQYAEFADPTSYMGQALADMFEVEGPVKANVEAVATAAANAANTGKLDTDDATLTYATKTELGEKADAAYVDAQLAPLEADIAGRLSDATLATVYSPLLLSTQKSVRNRDLVIDVVAEGADPTGVTTAQPQIGSSHNLLPATGGRIFLRKGSYKMSTRLIVTKQGFVLEGEGPDATTLLLDAAALQVGASDVLIRNLTLKGNGSLARLALQAVTTGAFKNWRWENVKFDGVGINPKRIGATEANGTVITTGTGLASHVEFDNCEILNYTEDGAIHVAGVDYATINNCWFHNLGTDTAKGDMLKFSAGAKYWQAKDSLFQDGTRDAIDCYDGQQGLVEGNRIVNMGAHGVEMKVVNASAPNPADRNRVIGNHIVNIGTASAAPAIQVATSHCMVQENLIEGGSAAGIRGGKVTDSSSNSQNTQIIGNQVRGMTGDGFSMNGVDGLMLRSNMSIGNTGRGYYVPLGVTNTLVNGGAADNQSRGNGLADVWA